MGDSGLATLVTAVVVAALAIKKETRGLAWRWGAAFVLVASLVFATKLRLFGWGNGIEAIGFRGPSGHATLAAFVWPMVAWLLTARSARPVRWAAMGVGAGLALGTAWVLVAYDFHSFSEVVAGSVLGGMGAGACVWTGRSAHPPSALVTGLAALTVAVLFGVQHGSRFGPLTQLERKAHKMVAPEKRPCNPIKAQCAGSRKPLGADRS